MIIMVKMIINKMPYDNDDDDGDNSNNNNNHINNVMYIC